MGDAVLNAKTPILFMAKSERVALDDSSRIWLKVEEKIIKEFGDLLTVYVEKPVQHDAVRASRAHDWTNGNEEHLCSSHCLTLMWMAALGPLTMAKRACCASSYCMVPVKSSPQAHYESRVP